MRKTLLLLIILAILLAIPLVASSYVLGIFIMVFFFALIGQGWNILCGYTGHISLGHSLFVGIGAYISTCLYLSFGLTPWIGMILGGSGAFLVGILMGYLGFRFGIRGIYFVLLTIAFAEISRLIALHMQFLGSFSGLFLDFQPSFYNMQFRSNVPYYYVILGLCIFSIVIVKALERSKMGLYFIAIRESEEAAWSLGVNIFRYKVYAVGISAFVTALGGTFYANYLFHLHPNGIMGVGLSIELILCPLIGGPGTAFGPLIGSFILTPLAEISRAYFSKGGLEGLHLAIYGFLTILVVLFLPKGVSFYLQRLVEGFLPGNSSV